jgi:NitT/TauT family transport system permease protein
LTNSSTESEAAPNAPSLELSLVGLRALGWLRSPKPYLMLIGYALLVGAWYLSVDALRLPRFKELPGVGQVIREWTSEEPSFGLSIFTPVYYEHILTSLRRVGVAFALATSLGVPVGLLLGWSPRFRDYVFPVLEVLRPIPILAWVPLAIIMFEGSETPVVFLTFLASFFATALNTQLGVRSIGAEYVLAARCLGAGKLAIFRHVILPGALPFIFTGLEVSVGVAWFSLVAAEMVSGQFGLGYVINTSYTMVQYPTIVIGMLTLGVVGYTTSAAVRFVGSLLMTYRARTLALGGA